MAKLIEYALIFSRPSPSQESQPKQSSALAGDTSVGAIRFFFPRRSRSGRPTDPTTTVILSRCLGSSNCL